MATSQPSYTPHVSSSEELGVFEPWSQGTDIATRQGSLNRSLGRQPDIIRCMTDRCRVSAESGFVMDSRVSVVREVCYSDEDDTGELGIESTDVKTPVFFLCREALGVGVELWRKAPRATFSCGAFGRM